MIRGDVTLQLILISLLSLYLSVPPGEEENKERTNISAGAEGEGEETKLDKRRTNFDRGLAPGGRKKTREAQKKRSARA